jgi:hypothetical protein
MAAEPAFVRIAKIKNSDWGFENNLMRGHVFLTNIK